MVNDYLENIPAAMATAMEMAMARLRPMTRARARARTESRVKNGRSERLELSNALDVSLVKQNTLIISFVPF